MEYKIIFSIYRGVSDIDLVFDCGEMKISVVLNGVLNYVFCFMEFAL